MEYQTLETLRQNHPAWRLLKADHAPLITSFLFRTFIKPNVRTIPESELVQHLEDYLYHLRRETDEDAFPRAARAYLDDWASDKHAWLRKYYPADSEEPNFDITPSIEQAIEWLASLSQRSFIGTESRLLTVFELLRQLAEGTETDPNARIAELERRRAEIDLEITRIEDGELTLIDATGVRERFHQISQLARGLLGDFRAVDQNFRDLDRAARERIATWDGAKGALLDEIFGAADAIADSDQGKSFRAFWDFLMSPERQDEFTQLLEKVLALEAVKELTPDRRIMRIHYDWLAAGDVTQRTVAKLSGELRRYLDDKAWLENRRIMDILREIEAQTLAIRDEPPSGPFMELDEMAPVISLPMERPMFSPPHKPVIDDHIETTGSEEIPADALFDHVYVDKDRLAAQVRRALQQRTQVTLSDIVEVYPLELGLAELVAYLGLAADDATAVIDEKRKETVSWTDDEGLQRQATMPRIVFARAVTVSKAAVGAGGTR